MDIYGCCRCSTDESRQDIMRQERELVQLEVKTENIFMEYASGVKRNRVELNRLLNLIKHKDTLVSTELSRITRSTKDLCEIVELAKEKKLKLVLGTFKVDFSQDTMIQWEKEWIMYLSDKILPVILRWTKRKVPRRLTVRWQQ